MITELNHLGVFTADLAATESFYTRLFGARVAWRASIDSMDLDILYLQVGGGLIEFLSFGDAEKNTKQGADHLGFVTDDLDGDHAQLVERGYESLTEPKASGSGVGRQAWVLDPDGVRIELLERDLDLRPAPVVHPIVQELDHFSVRVDDLQKSLDFFRSGLGLRDLCVLETASGGKITYLASGDDTIELVEGLGSGPRLHHMALRVADVDAALASFRAAGFQTDGPSRAAGTGLGRLGSITDPNGITIEVLDRSALADLASPSASHSQT